LSGKRRIAAIVGVWVLAGGGPCAAAGHEPDIDRVRRAIAISTASRVGAAVEVDVQVSDVRLVGGAGGAEAILAAPDIGARFGRPSRFTLFAGGRRRVRLGEATATVRGVTDVVRTRRPFLLGERIGGDDVEVVRTTIEGMRLAVPPTVDAIVGARAARFLPVGTVMGSADVMAEPMVKAGDHVRAVVRLAAGVEIHGVAVALQSGERQQVIALMNPESHQTRRGRVVGRGEVEVVDAR